MHDTYEISKMVERIIIPLYFSRASGIDYIRVLAELSSCEPELLLTLFDSIIFDSFKDQIARAFDVFAADCDIALDIAQDLTSWPSLQNEV